METDQKPFEGWALVEVMGHNRYAGFVSEQTVAGSSFVRVDVPESEGSPAFTKLLGSSSIFAITPTTEDIARGVAKRWQCRPISVFDLPVQERIPPRLEHATVPNDDDEEDDGCGVDEPCF